MVINLVLWVSYSQSASCVEFLINFCMHDEICAINTEYYQVIAI